MENRFGPSLRGRLEQLAAELGVDWMAVQTAAGQHPLHVNPGNVSDQVVKPHPLPRGSVVDLPTYDGGNGWVVAGYLQDSFRNFLGYDLRRGPWWLETATCRWHAKMNIVEVYKGEPVS